MGMRNIEGSTRLELRTRALSCRARHPIASQTSRPAARPAVRPTNCPPNRPLSRRARPPCGEGTVGSVAAGDPAGD